MFPEEALQTLRGTAGWSAPAKFRAPTPARALQIGLTVMLLAYAVPAKPEGPGEGGVIHGTVRITEKLAEQRMRFRLYPGFKPAPAPVDRETRDDEYRNIVIYLKFETPPASEVPGSHPVFRMTQEGETFIPHVLPVPVGATV